MRANDVYWEVVDMLMGTGGGGRVPAWLLEDGFCMISLLSVGVWQKKTPRASAKGLENSHFSKQPHLMMVLLHQEYFVKYFFRDLF